PVTIGPQVVGAQGVDREEEHVPTPGRPGEAVVPRCSRTPVLAAAAGGEQGEEEEGESSRTHETAGPPPGDESPGYELRGMNPAWGEPARRGFAPLSGWWGRAGRERGRG